MPKKKTNKDVETGAGYASQNPFARQDNPRPDNQGQSPDQQGQDTSLERGESMQGVPVPSSADPMDAHLMRDPDPYNPNTPEDGMDGEAFDEATDQEDTDGMMRDPVSAADADLALEDEENRVQDGYGAGRVMHGVDIDAPSDSGTFGNPQQPETTRKLSGNQR